MVLFVFLALVASWNFVALRFAMNRQHPPATTAALAAGVAERPFQFRVLVPWIEGMIYKSLYHTPLTTFRMFWFPGLLDTAHAKVFLARQLPPEAVEDYAGLLGIMKGIEFISVVMLVFLLRHYLTLFFNDGTVASVAAFALFYILPFNYLYNYFYFQSLFYPYDIPSIVFFTAGLVFIYKEQWVPYYILFALATVNRETTCFLTMVYLFTALGRSRPKTIALHCLAQAVLWVGIKYSLAYVYGDNPGEGLFTTKLYPNYVFFFQEDPLRSYPYFFRNLGYLWVPVIILSRLIKERFVRRSLLVLIPFTVGMLVVGNIHELRIWGEMIPVVLPAFVLILKELHVKFEAGELV